MRTGPPTILPAVKPDRAASLALGERLHFVDPVALVHLSRGLTLNPLRSAEVLDDALVALDEKTGYVSRVQNWVVGGGLHNGSCPVFPDGRIILDITERMSVTGQKLHMASVIHSKQEAGLPPAVFLSMESPSLSIGMRVEMSLRSILKGNAQLEETYTLYLHVLLTSDDRQLVYYGITKRGWNLRFSEHTRAALAKRSQRLFARTLSDLTEARANELYGSPDGRPALRGLITTICASGLTRTEAMDAEEKMVDKYSLSSKHPSGLNMISGGVAGIRQARQFKR